LTPALKSGLQKKLEQLLGKKLEMTYKTDPALIGGVITKIGNQVFDGSIKTQLQSLGHYLAKGI
jgi:F-type H+-transporting ATPase subunit delta